jgi:hypothetical protein
MTTFPSRFVDTSRCSVAESPCDGKDGQPRTPGLVTWLSDDDDDDRIAIASQRVMATLLAANQLVVAPGALADRLPSIDLLPSTTSLRLLQTRLQL